MEVRGQVLVRKIILCGVSRPAPSQLWWAGECVRNRKYLPNVDAAFALDETKGTLHPPHFAKERLRENYSYIIKFRAYIPYKSDNTIIFMLVCGGEGAERAWELKCYKDRETLKMLEILRLLL